MLDLIDVEFDYQEHSVLKKVSIHVPAGGLLHLKGSNGAGKTTLIKLVSGLYGLEQGSILFNKKNIMDDLANYQKQITYIGHKLGINPYLSPKENCLFDAHYSGEDVETLLSIFKLETYLHAPCALLSAGQKRQVGLLRLWMSKTTLWLLDEPLVALDDKALNILMIKIEDHLQQGGSVIVSSHQNIPYIGASYEEYHL